MGYFAEQDMDQGTTADWQQDRLLDARDAGLARFVAFELHAREPRSESCWIFVDGVLVEKCAAADRVARLAAHGRIETPLGRSAQLKMEAAQRGNHGGSRMGNRYSGR